MNLHWLIVFVIVYFLLKVLLNHIGSSVIFQPRKADQHYLPDLVKHQRRLGYQLKSDVKLEDVTIPTQDGETLRGLLLTNPAKEGYVIFSHGNAGNIYGRLSLFSILGQLGSVLIYDYRGYGLSTGVPSEAGVYRDVWDSWHYLINKGVDPNKIILMGESLGASISCWLGHRLASKDPSMYPSGLIMVAGFSSLRDVITDLHGSILSHLADSEFESKQYIKEIGDKFPVLVLHSQDDELIPYHHHKKLIDANNHAIHLEIKGDHSFPVYDDRVIEAMKQIVRLV